VIRLLIIHINFAACHMGGGGEAKMKLDYVWRLIFIFFQIRRRIKQVPLAFYRTTPTSLFSESDFPGWTFESKLHENKIENGIEMKNDADEIDQTRVKRPRVET
jgi:hypothetical protein